MKKIGFGFWIIVYLFFIDRVEAQTLSVKVDKDSISINDRIKLEITLHNVDGVFNPPLLQDWQVLSGPSINTSVMIVNGNKSQTKTFIYIIQPQKTGILFIESVNVLSNEGEIKSDQIAVKVFQSEVKIPIHKIKPKIYEFGKDKKTTQSTNPKRVLKRF